MADGESWDIVTGAHVHLKNMVQGAARNGSCITYHALPGGGMVSIAGTATKFPVEESATVHVFGNAVHIPRVAGKEQKASVGDFSI